MKKKIAIGLAAVLVVGAIGMLNSSKKGAKQPAYRTVTVDKGNLQSTVNTTGMVYSSDATQVYSDLAYSINAVNVSVGDKVKEGDILAELDTAKLEETIAQQSSSAGAQSSASNNSIALAKKRYQNSKADLEGDLNGTISQAETAVDNAKRALEQAEISYDLAAQTLTSKRQEARYSGLGDAEEDMMLAPFISQRDLAYAQYESAKAAVKTAEENLTITKNGVKQQLEAQADDIKTAEIAAGASSAQWIAIENMKKDLEKCQVKAPISGTITSVNAVEGAPGSGLLFVIQNTEDLKVVTTVREFDVANIAIGDEVIIKSNATGDYEFKGKVSKIAPTSKQTEAGKTITSTESDYEAEITVKPDKKALLIGMNTRINIITKEKAGVTYVPYEAVSTDDDGSYIFEVITVDDKTSLKKIPVEQGLETNLYVEISGPDVREGMEVVKDAESINPADIKE